MSVPCMNPLVGKLMTPRAHPRAGPRAAPRHSKHGQKGRVLAVCPSGTNGLICERGVLVLLMETNTVVVDSVDNWVPA